MQRPAGFIEPPPEIAERTRLQQQSVPDLGLGWKRTLIPEKVYLPLRRLWQTRRRQAVTEPANPAYLGSTCGAPPTQLVTDPARSEATLAALEPVMREWYGAPLVGSAAYGLRVYREGAFLHNHVDRTETHVISATLCIDYALERPWPLYLRDREGREHFVHLPPGEMILYESASLEHGRPLPLVGRYYVGMFVHYRPVDWSHRER